MLLPLIGLATSTGALAAGWMLAGVFSALIWTGLNTLMVGAAPANRGGAVSLIGAFKFAGNAVAPVLWVPLYAIEPMLAFAGAGVAAALVALATLHAAGAGVASVLVALATARAAVASTGPQAAQGPVETEPPTPESARRTIEFGTP